MTFNHKGCSRSGITWYFRCRHLRQLLLLSDSALDAQGSVPMQWLNFVEYIYPVSETLAMVAVLTSIWLGASLIRVIKSWIPTEG